MLRITVELVPLGVESEAREIGRMIIANNGDGDSMFGDYDFVYKSDRGIVRGGQVLGWGRNNGVWHLISECVSNPTNDEETRLMERMRERLEND